MYWQRGPTVVTQLPDYVIAERCQNTAEKRSMHIRQRARRGEVQEKQNIKKTGRESRGQFRRQADARVKGSKRRESTEPHCI